jgi:hypothetical protein
MLRVLRRRAFTLLWSGGLLSLVGDWESSRACHSSCTS